MPAPRQPGAHSATVDDIRRRNLATLLAHLHRTGPATRSELAARMSVNRSTVAALVADLGAVGLVREEAGAGGTVGRPSLVVAPVDSSAAVLAFDLRVERVVSALVGLGGATLARVERHSTSASITPSDAVRTIAALAQEMMLPGVPVVGVAVALPGLVRSDDGLVVLAPNLGWSQVLFGDLLAGALASALPTVPPIAIGNDADFGATVEFTRGAAAGARNVVFLSGEVGVGGGIVLDGEVMSGRSGFSGEVGHMVVNPLGRPCRCGARGCWETEIGRAAVLDAAGLSEPARDVPDLREVASADAAAAQRIDAVADWMGIGLANLVNIFSPDVIVLGGHLRALHQAAQATVERRVLQALPSTRDSVVLAYPDFGPSAALMGAAEVAFDALLHDPLGSLAAAAGTSPEESEAS